MRGVVISIFLLAWAGCHCWLVQQCKAAARSTAGQAGHHVKRGRGTRGVMAIFLLAWAAAASCAAAADAARGPVWELRPYRVQVLVGVAGRPELPAALPAALADRLAERIRALEGGAWDVTVAPASPALRQAMAASLVGVAAAALPADPPGTDKFMLVLVSAAPDGYQVAAREFDVATGLWSATVVRPARQLGKLPDESLSAILRAFAPLARLSDVKDGRVMLRLRAGWLRPRDAEAVRAGDAFRLVARGVGAQAAPDARPIPWTFCTVEEVAEEALRGRLETGLREPLPPRWENALEVLALGVVPSERPSVLSLKSTAQPPQALAGYEVYAAGPAAGRPVLLGRTDARGSLSIAPAPDRLVQILLVKHGNQWLARLPMVTGLEPQLAAAVAQDDDSVALQAALAGVRDAAVDLTARRAMLLGRLKARMAAGQLAEAEQLLKELRQLPGAKDFIASRAGELKKDLPGDAATQAKLDAALGELERVLAAQFDAKAIDELAAQLHKGQRKAKKR